MALTIIGKPEKVEYGEIRRYLDEDTNVIYFQGVTADGRRTEPYEAAGYAKRMLNSIRERDDSVEPFRAAVVEVLATTGYKIARHQLMAKVSQRLGHPPGRYRSTGAWRTWADGILGQMIEEGIVVTLDPDQVPHEDRFGRAGKFYYALTTHADIEEQPDPEEDTEEDDEIILGASQEYIDQKIDAAVVAILESTKLALDNVQTTVVAEVKLQEERMVSAFKRSLEGVL